jgi:uncharacterized BrkB/YihY/UPF0761 family membrane protein
MSRDGELTSLDMVSVVVAGLAAIALAIFPFIAASFARVFKDLGGEIPLFTRMVLVPWQPVLALASAGAIAFGLRARRPLRQRRVALAGAFALAFFSFAGCVIGLYLPIFALAGSIKAD